MQLNYIFFVGLASVSTVVLLLFYFLIVSRHNKPELLHSQIKRTFVSKEKYSLSYKHVIKNWYTSPKHISLYQIKNDTPKIILYSVPVSKCK